MYSNDSNFFECNYLCHSLFSIYVSFHYLGKIFLTVFKSRIRFGREARLKQNEMKWMKETEWLKRMKKCKIEQKRSHDRQKFKFTREWFFCWFETNTGKTWIFFEKSEPKNVNEWLFTYNLSTIFFKLHQSND